jgi:hypothetical protein
LPHGVARRLQRTSTSRRSPMPPTCRPVRRR